MQRQKIDAPIKNLWSVWTDNLMLSIGPHVDFDGCTSKFWRAHQKVWRRPNYVKTLNRWWWILSQPLIVFLLFMHMCNNLSCRHWNQKISKVISLMICRQKISCKFQRIMTVFINQAWNLDAQNKWKPTKTYEMHQRWLMKHNTGYLSYFARRNNLKNLAMARATCLCAEADLWKLKQSHRNGFLQHPAVFVICCLSIHLAKLIQIGLSLLLQISWISEFGELHCLSNQFLKVCHFSNSYVAWSKVFPNFVWWQDSRKCESLVKRCLRCAGYLFSVN